MRSGQVLLRLGCVRFAYGMDAMNVYACAVAWLVPVSPLVVVAQLKLLDARRQLAAWRCLGDTGGLASLTHTSKLCIAIKGLTFWACGP